MPLWTPVEEIGLLLQDGDGLILRRDDGGLWRLDARANHFTFVNHRVRVTGTRSGFDLIDVKNMAKADA